MLYIYFIIQNCVYFELYMVEHDGKHKYFNFSDCKDFNPIQNIAGKKTIYGWIWSKCVTDKNNG